MEKGVDSRSCWYNVLDKNSEFVDWMKRQQNTNISMVADDYGGGGGTTNESEAPTNMLVSSCDGAGGDSGTSILQPLSYSYNAFPAGGGGMGCGFPPFTGAQWKELERQAMIYKCMNLSLPLPSHLLDSTLPSAVYGGRYSSRKGDAEPGRCKRTDGKKWRCARDVAPLQKYCDRHLHRGRPRSRKPVELSNNNHRKASTTRLRQNKITNTIPTNNHLGTTKLPWENIELPDIRSTFDPDYAAAVQQPLNLFAYPNFTSQEVELPIDNLHNRSVESSISLSEGGGGGYPSPSLSLSMAMATATGAVVGEDGNEDDSIWLGPVCWELFAGGGPLGEALHPGTSSNPASPYDSSSTPATTVSSPSGVLHRTLISHSDGSVCNSPTFSNHYCYN